MCIQEDNYLKISYELKLLVQIFYVTYIWHGWSEWPLTRYWIAFSLSLKRIKSAYAFVERIVKLLISAVFVQWLNRSSTQFGGHPYLIFTTCSACRDHAGAAFMKNRSGEIEGAHQTPCHKWNSEVNSYPECQSFCWKGSFLLHALEFSTWCSTTFKIVARSCTFQCLWSLNHLVWRSHVAVVH